MDFIMETLCSKWSWIFSIIGLLYFIFSYGKRRTKYFEMKGIKYKKFYPFIGNTLQQILQKEHLMDVIHKFYNYFPDERYVGIMVANMPVIMIRDLKLLKQICIKDFDHFLNHQNPITEDIDPLFGNNLMVLRGDKWRDMRATLSPAFTSSRMKSMYNFVVEIGKQMADYYVEKVDEPECRERGLIELEMKDAFSRYTNDVIATSAFGIRVNSLRERDNEFHTMAKKAADFSGLVIFKFIMFQLFPAAMKILRVNLFHESITDFFRNLILHTMKRRQQEGIMRHDLINILIEAQKGSLKYESNLTEESEGFAVVQESEVGRRAVKRNWTDDELVAQAIAFFVAGFENASTVLCFMAHEMALNSDIQQKLQDEIDDIISQKGENLDYSDLSNMTYMDMVVTETLRKWPPAVSVDRECSKSYNLPPPSNSTNKNVNIQPGQLLWIPIVAIHHDPEYYSNPDKFDPERFSESNKANVNPLAFMPFGMGPRNCIGSRFALMEVKAVMFHMLAKFSFVETAKTQNPIKIAKNTFHMHTENGFWIGLKPRFQTKIDDGAPII